MIGQDQEGNNETARQEEQSNPIENILRDGPLAEGGQEGQRFSMMANEIKRGNELDYKIDSAPYTLQKPRGKLESSPLPQHTQVETADTLRQNDFNSHLEVGEDEQSPNNDNFVASPPVASVRDHHQEFLTSNINNHEQQTEADFAQICSSHSPNSCLQQDAQASEFKPTLVHHESKIKTSKKDFVGENATRIKTIREIQQANSDKRLKRASEVASRNSHNPYGYKFFGVTEKGGRGFEGFQQVYRSQEWNKVLIMNKEIDRKTKLHADKKNQITNLAFKQAPVPSTPQSRNSTKINFFSSKKEEAYNKTLQSSINMLSSFKTLELVDSKAQEKKLVPKSKDQVHLASNLNRKSRLDQGTYGRAVEVPSEYYSFQPKPEIIHNISNSHVMLGRRRNSYKSSLFFS